MTGTNGRNNRGQQDWFGNSTNWRNEMALRWGNQESPRIESNRPEDDDVEEISPQRNVLTSEILLLN